jgi:hypothetical protein
VFDDPDWVFGNARSESFQTSASSILAFGENLIVGGRYGGFDAGGFVTGPHDAAVWIGTPISEEGQ